MNNMYLMAELLTTPSLPLPPPSVFSSSNGYLATAKLV